jgi:hypothetical protein
MDIFSFVLASFIAQGVTSPAPLKVPYYDWNACPFECCVYRTWKAEKAITVLKERRVGSPVAFELPPGEMVQAYTGVVVTTHAGELRVMKDRMIGRFNIAVQAGDVVRVLRPEGEGYFKIWAKGHVDSEELNDLGDLDESTSLTLISKPRITWWVKVRTRDGRVGWTTATDDFSGIDACG